MATRGDLQPIGLLVVALGAGCGDAASADRPLAGGDTTVADRTSNAYGMPAANLDEEELARHLDGDVAFGSMFVTPPAVINPGLGPLFNHVGCEGCHVRDGRGLPQVGSGAASQSLIRVSLPDGVPDAPGGQAPVPGIGLQLQDHAVFGATPEATVAMTWREESGQFADGASYSLRRPELAITLPDGSPPPTGLETSLRQPPPVFGLGLLEAVPEEVVLERADPDDADGDGVSGRPNRVWDPLLGAVRLGRFGHKANAADLPLQVAAAYRNDMGVGNPIFAYDDASEIDDATLDDAVFYCRTLGVPAPAPEVGDAHGERLFDALGCAGCHAPALETGDHEIAALAFQRIAPYTDLLLHDLGDGLADGRPDFAATGREWRTAPLWGIGLVQTVLPGAGYLHDGRARDLAEAILWHGGEAEPSRERFRTASTADREALLDFLGSL
jgi:CxxC motif-containing protein (DUF1111 family)